MTDENTTPGRSDGAVGSRNPVHKALEMAVKFIEMLQFNADEKLVPTIGPEMKRDIDWILMVAEGLNRPYMPEEPKYDVGFAKAFDLPFTIGTESKYRHVMAHWHQESFATMTKNNPHPIGMVALQLYSRLRTLYKLNDERKRIQTLIRIMADEFMAMRMVHEDLGLVNGEKLMRLKQIEDDALYTAVEMGFK